MLLWGALLGAAPIIIHLLNRRKFRETQWAAMKFLLEAVRKNSRRLRIEQLILLAVRVLILCLLAGALAQPMLEQLGAFFQAAQPTHKILVLDASASMAVQPADGTLFDRQKELARQIVESARQGDVFQLVRLSNLPPAVIVEAPAYQPAQVIEEIEQMRLPHGRGNLLESLREVEPLLKSAPDVPQKEVVLISDFQRATWAPDSIEQLAELKALLKRLDRAARLVIVDLGQAAAENVGIIDFTTQETFATTGRPARFKATIRNFGNERVVARTLELLVDDKLADQRTINLNPGAEQVEQFAHTFGFGGEHRVQVRLQRDAYGLDDQRWMAVPVRDRIRVLCVDGKSAGGNRARATDFLSMALAPEASAATLSATGVRSQVEPHVVDESELTGLDLTPYDCLFLCNIRLFTERESALIESYLKGGGGVVWCLGDQVQAENYNDVLHRQGAGPLPARLGDRKGDAARRTEVFQFDPGEFTHPIIGAFQGNPDAGLETSRSYAYMQATVVPNSPARIALRFDSGDPAIVETTFGRGRSILIATAVDDSWGTWALWPSYLPLIHEIVHFAVSGRWGERQHLVGEPLTQVFPAPAIDVDAAIRRPDDQTLPLAVVRDGDFGQISFDSTGISGIYELTLAHPLSRTELFAVNVDPRESDLTKFAQDELAADLFEGLETSYRTTWHGDEPLSGDMGGPRKGGLTRWLLYAALYLLFTEQLLAWDFRRGLWLLCPPAALVPWLWARRSP